MQRYTSVTFSLFLIVIGTIVLSAVVGGGLPSYVTYIGAPIAAAGCALAQLAVENIARRARCDR